MMQFMLGDTWKIYKDLNLVSIMFVGIALGE